MKKLTLALAISLLATPVTYAQSLSGALKECGQQQNSLKRLVCYDRIVNEMDKYSGLDELMNVPAPLPARTGDAARTGNAPANDRQAPPARRAAPPANPTSDFGLPDTKTKQDTPEKIFSQVASIRKDPYGNRTVTLANGQVWKQQESSNIRLKKGEDVYVETGVLGSFFLSKESVNKRMRVKRIK